MSVRRQKPGVVLFCIAVLGGFLAFSFGASADEDIRQQIDQKSEEIKKLEEEAKKFRGVLEETGRQVRTLQGDIRELDRRITGLEATIRVTNAKIARTNLEIKALGQEIQEKEATIAIERDRLRHLVGILAAGDNETPIEILMKNQTLAAFFTSIEYVMTLERDIHSALGELRRDREVLKGQKTEAEKKKLELAALTEDLADQKTLQLEARRGRSALLTETKNQERRFQELLVEVERKREALQQEINSLEAKLVARFDRSLLPKAGTGILGWPLPDPIFITQYFGQTAFARSGAYNGNGHNGIDFRAPLGTAVFASEGGVVRASGDTDLACRRSSYGRWILIDHPNRLATLYAHLSLLKVTPGASVSRGELIGYSGFSGYATGPHLHFTVFARDAVEVGILKSRACGTNMTLPLSPFGGYLNPLDYL
ncbi:MAG: peptidoglycan DD-metalloendopeptidase family protein [Candidatus Sungbacteria bacterium]|uniref:Peptidoglycan DD-metalloendopeptidase family protein n=1 Tax=Candidatus Sungiibacteriota bacterium TaxID=2750080 RepID=A0A932YWB2_9BACT|nr:peptidoglycan DD-metalloendopeptidase family protein [Candidatus Sungbacteria bacterium]